MMRPILFVFLAIAAISCGGGGGGNQSNSPTAPSGSGGTAPTAGAWTGTLTRPGGLGTLSLRWEVTTDADGLVGPLTLTNGAASATVTARGNTSGNDRGYRVHMSFNAQLVNAPAGGCTIRGATSGPQEGEPFPSPYTRITIPTFSIQYSGCRGGLISTGYPNAQSDFLEETARLELSK